MLLFYKINLSYTLLSQYWRGNAAKLIENADTRLSVKYLFTENIILQRAVREDKASLREELPVQGECTPAQLSRAPRAAEREPGPYSHAVINTPNKSSGSLSR